MFYDRLPRKVTPFEEIFSTNLPQHDKIDNET